MPRVEDHAVTWTQLSGKRIRERLSRDDERADGDDPAPERGHRGIRVGARGDHHIRRDDAMLPGRDLVAARAVARCAGNACDWRVLVDLRASRHCDVGETGDVSRGMQSAAPVVHDAASVGTRADLAGQLVGRDDADPGAEVADQFIRQDRIPRVLRRECMRPPGARTARSHTGCRACGSMWPCAPRSPAPRRTSVGQPATRSGRGGHRSRSSGRGGPCRRFGSWRPIQSVRASSTTTRAPRAASSYAVERPVKPAPTTTTSARAGGGPGVVAGNDAESVQ